MFVGYLAARNFVLERIYIATESDILCTCICIVCIMLPAIIVSKQASWQANHSLIQKPGNLISCRMH